MLGIHFDIVNVISGKSCWTEVFLFRSAGWKGHMVLNLTHTEPVVKALVNQCEFLLVLVGHLEK
jgi:hypothetical protein